MKPKILSKLKLALQRVVPLSDEGATLYTARLKSVLQTSLPSTPNYPLANPLLSLSILYINRGLTQE
jgi:hypothetical protein